MHTGHHSPERWDQWLKTTHGQEIVASLATVRQYPPLLTSPGTDLAAKLRAGMAPFNRQVPKLWLLSVGALNETLRQLQSLLADQVWEETRTALLQSLRAWYGTDLWFEILYSQAMSAVRVALGDDRWEIIEQAVLTEVWDTPWFDLDNCLGAEAWSGSLAQRATKSFMNLLCYRIAFLSRNAVAEAAAIDELLELFRHGHFPIGRLRAGQFLVLVE